MRINFSMSVQKPSFWRDTSNVSHWASIKSIWTSATPPRLLEASRIITEITTSEMVAPGLYYGRAIFQNAKAYSQFIASYFVTGATTASVILDIPSEVIADGFIHRRWVGIEARDEANNLVGLIISKYINILYSSQFPVVPLKECGLVDYFCVVPDWRRKGVGTALLFRLHELTRSQGRIAQIFASEGGRGPLSIFSRIPSFIQDRYIWRQRNNARINLEIESEKNIAVTHNLCERIRGSSPSTKYFFAFAPGVKTDISHYWYKDGSASADLLIKPTYEIKDGNHVGEVVAFWYSGKGDKYLDIMIDLIQDFYVMIAPSEFPQSRSWTNGAYFGFFPFHFHPGEFDMKSRLLVLV